MREVIRHLRRAALLHKGDGPTDGQLLESFVARREAAAFEALLRRHGPMVLGVCQRILRNIHDAEDAFQATFLVLSRKASSILPREMVGNWLYGVAYRTAMKARAMSIKRRTKERQAAQTSCSPGQACEELLEQLDHQLSRLPDKYRVPVVLCELEGKSRKEVACLLGIPEGTLSWRLAQAKKILARRLSRYGSVALAALLSQSAASASLTPALCASTVKTALTAGVVPAKVLALTEGVIKGMLLTKLKIIVCVATMALVAGVGATGLTYRAIAEEPKQAEYYGKLHVKSTESRPASDDLEALRLEIDALRKSLQATRERVKTLEGEVSALKRQGYGPQGMAPGGGLRPPGAGGPPGGMQGGIPGGMRGSGGVMPPRAGVPDLRSGLGARPGSAATPGMMSPMKQKQKTDPVTDAENALKILRENPGDIKATEALEQALKQLKEREKPDVPGELYRR